MTAPRIDLARSAVAARPLPSRPARPAPEETRRPDLRLVPQARPRRGAAVAVLTLIVVCGALLGTAVLHTMLVSGQRQVDRLDGRIRATEQANQSRRLAVAELESPGRVVAEATRAGMVEPDSVTWLTHDPDGTIESSRRERTVSAEAADAPGDEDPAGSTVGVEETDPNG